MICLGIDGGGFKTVFLLADHDGREIGRVQSGPSNWLSVGGDAAAAAIRDGISRLKGPQPDAVCGGFAGAGRPEGREFYKTVLTPLFRNSRVRIESDAFIAYVGAIGLQPGVLLIAGTGSIAIGRKEDGSLIRAGGWGPHFGDEGSGFWIGREAVRSALKSRDSGTESPFSLQLAGTLGLKSIRDVVPAWSEGRLGVPDIAGLVPAVLNTWPREPAAEILRAAATHLRGLMETAVGLVGIAACPRSATGSVATNPLIRDLIGIDFAAPLAPPERGAVLLAAGE
jgi:N-acetylglucosamine kinase-like BadF-type ATPase